MQWWFAKTNTASPNVPSFLLRGRRQRSWDWSWRKGVVFIPHYPTLSDKKWLSMSLHCFAHDNNWQIISLPLSWPQVFHCILLLLSRDKCLGGHLVSSQGQSTTHSLKSPQVIKNSPSNRVVRAELLNWPTLCRAQNRCLQQTLYHWLVNMSHSCRE